MRGIQIAGRIVEMFEYVEHRNGGAAFGSEGGSREGRADGGDTGASPSRVGCIERKIETDGAHVAAFGEHLQEQAAAAADIEDESRFIRFA